MERGGGAFPGLQGHPKVFAAGPCGGLPQRPAEAEEGPRPRGPGRRRGTPAQGTQPVLTPRSQAPCSRDRLLVLPETLTLLCPAVPSPLAADLSLCPLSQRGSPERSGPGPRRGSAAERRLHRAACGASDAPLLSVPPRRCKRWLPGGGRIASLLISSTRCLGRSSRGPHPAPSAPAVGVCLAAAWVALQRVNVLDSLLLCHWGDSA